MSEPITLSLHANNELVEIVVQAAHPMDAGEALHPKTGEAIPACFLRTIAIQLNEKTLLEGQMGPALTKDPVFRFSFKRVKAGDKFLVSFTDNKEQKFEKEIIVPVF